MFKRKTALPKVAPEFKERVPVDGVEKALDILSKENPSFSLEEFLEEAEGIFLQVKEAFWSKDEGALRYLLVDPALSSLIFQVQHLEDHFRSYQVRGLELLSAKAMRSPSDLPGSLGIRFSFVTASEKTVHSTSGAVFIDHGGSHHVEDMVFVKSEHWQVARISTLS